MTKFSLSELLQVRPLAMTYRLYISPHGKFFMMQTVPDVLQQLDKPLLRDSSKAVYVIAPGTGDHVIVMVPLLQFIVSVTFSGGHGAEEQNTLYGYGFE